MLTIGLSIVLYGFMDLNQDNYLDAEVLSVNDSTRTGHIDTITLRLADLEKTRELSFFVISDSKNNFPWKSNVSKINTSSIVKITAPSGIASVKSEGFRVRVAEKGKPELNIVTDLETDFVCQPAIKDPYFQVWAESIKVRDESPFSWEVDRDHQINYTKTEKGILVKGKGTVLRQSTQSMPRSIQIVGKGRFDVVIKSKGGKIRESFSGNTRTFLDASNLPKEGDYTINIKGRENLFALEQFGNGKCINSLN